MNGTDPTARSYRVLVVRERGWWMAWINGLPEIASRAHTLRRLDAYVRDFIGQALGLAATASRDVEIEYEFRTGDAALDQLVAAARAARRAAAVEEQRAYQLARQALASAGAQHLSRRDLAVMLEMSHQKVQQLADKLAAGGPAARR